MFLTRPGMMTLQDWADCVTLDLRVGGIGKLSEGQHWQDWAVQLLNTASLSGNKPNPYQFEEWSAWAERLCEVLQ